MESYTTLAYFRQYLLDLNTVPPASITGPNPPSVTIDPSVSYYRAYLGRI